MGLIGGTYSTQQKINQSNMSKVSSSGSYAKKPPPILKAPKQKTSRSKDKKQNKAGD